MLASHSLLVTRVTHKKKTYRTYVGVDASAVNLLRPAMYGAYHHITNMDRPEAVSYTHLPQVGDNELMLTEMPHMNLYDETDLISNITGDYVDKNLSLIHI